MAEVTLSLTHTPAVEEQPCGVCGASFSPAEDSGSRILRLKSGQQHFGFLMCGGCHSKWTHGSTVTVRSMKPAT
jgi:hypothetical protein